MLYKRGYIKVFNLIFSLSPNLDIDTFELVLSIIRHFLSYELIRKHYSPKYGLSPTQIHSILCTNFLKSNENILDMLINFLRKYTFTYTTAIINPILGILSELCYYTPLKWKILRYNIAFLQLFEKYYDKDHVNMSYTIEYVLDFFINFFEDPSFTSNSIVIGCINKYIKYLSRIFITLPHTNPLIEKFLKLFNFIIIKPSTLNIIFVTCRSSKFISSISKILKNKLPYHIQCLADELYKTIFYVISIDDKYCLEDSLNYKIFIEILSSTNDYYVNSTVINILNKRLTYGSTPLASSHNKVIWKGIYANNKNIMQLYIVSNDSLYIYPYNEKTKNLVLKIYFRMFYQ